MNSPSSTPTRKRPRSPQGNIEHPYPDKRRLPYRLVSPAVDNDDFYMHQFSGCAPESGEENPPMSPQRHNLAQDDMYTSVCNSEDGANDVCFGMICNIHVLFRQNPDELSSTVLEPTSSPSLKIFPISFCKNRMCVVSNSGEEVATLDIKVSQSFQELSKYRQVRFEALIPIQKNVSQETTSSGKESLQNEKIGINIYGQREASEHVASDLGHAGLFLQDPHWKPENFPYENPQYLELPDYQPEVEIPFKSLGHTEQKNVTIQDPSVDSFELDFDVLMDSLLSPEDHIQATADQRVRTPLKEHQQKGLDFIMKRERISSIYPPSLWKAEEMETGQIRYHHVITGAKCSTAPDALGGILADDMGLGKTLTMLAAVTGTTTNAWQYARENTTWSVENEEGLIAAKTTLLIVPSTLLMDGWIKEIEKHLFPGSLSYFKYHGQNRAVSPLMLLQHDIVLTTYGTVAADISRRRNMLHRIHWFRVVLDEAHVIRNVSTNQFSAVLTLQAHIRWCLTGTPIQNSLDDLGSLIKFLRIPSVEDASQFRAHITNKAHPTKANPKSDFENLRVLLSAVCLRRNNAILYLHQPMEHTYELKFSSSERRDYNNILNAFQKAIRAAVNENESAKAHQTVLDGLLRLRMFCNNGNLPGTPTEEVGSLLQQDRLSFCSLCLCDVLSYSPYADSRSGCITQCRRIICSDCVGTYKEDLEIASRCLLCHLPHGGLTTGTSEEDADCDTSSWECPSKLTVLCKDIQEHQHEGKCIVFSFWKSSLDIVERILGKEGVAHVRVDGSLPVSKRRQALDQFRMSQDFRVLLMTLGTGAVGLNDLTVAHRVHILEPQWNPSVESQAIGRVVRLGQRKPVQVIRYVMRCTIEMNVQNRQQRKIQLAKGGFNRALRDMICGAEE